MSEMREYVLQEASDHADIWLTLADGG